MKIFRNTQLIVFLQRFFYIFGLATFSINECNGVSGDLKIRKLKFSESRLGVFYNVGVIILIISCCTIGFYIQYMLGYKKKISLFEIVGFFLIFLGSAVAVLIQFNYCTNQKSLIKILTKIYVMSQTLNILNPVGKKYSPVTYIIIILLIYISFEVTFLTTGILYLYQKQILLLFITIFLPKSIIVLLVFQYTCIAKILLSMFKNINKSISRTRNAKVSFNTKIRILRMYKFSKWKNLSTLFTIYATLFDLTTQVSNFFGFMILCCFSYIFASLVGSMYFILVFLIEKKLIFDFIAYLHEFLFIIYYIVCIVSLTRTITEITNEV